ncbi:uncharacterized protein LOC133824895 [Humulus lupulus]|uniref:uncharacterized protein LOC133824895 n=1 Tax=Humulus lupulus TaxID=3486 RepID=UPI002B402971|nr:uncharacterized protein LOC133824895 [Humulus lupulus]
MTTINVFVNYDGHWDDKKCYVDFKMTGILVPKETTYKRLTGLLFKELNIKPSEHSITVQYQVSPGSPPITILTDSGVLFYLALKKKDPVLTGFPLCITIEDKRLALNNQAVPINQVQAAEQRSETANGEEHDESNHLNALPTPTNSDNHTSDNHIFDDVYDSPMEVETIEPADYVDRSILTRSRAIVEAKASSSKRRPYKKHKQKRDAVSEYEMTNTIISEYHYSEIAVKQLYKNKDVLKKVVSMFAIRNNFQYKVRRSDKRFFLVTCLDQTCKWLLRASKFLKTDMFIVRKYVPTHTCSLDVKGDHRQASSRVIGECIKSKYKLLGETSYSPYDIIRDMKDEYGVSISYEKAWRARECALDMIRGAPEESYENILSYLYTLKNKNLGSVTHLGTDNDNHFKYLFMALGASVNGWPHCRPVIVVDETFLKAKHSRILFTACAKDANDKIFPLAFGISDFDNDASWDWFLTKLRDAYGDRDGLCIISDQQSNICASVKKVYPNAKHGFCMTHVLNNLKTKFKSCGKEIVPTFIAAARSYIKDDFEYYMKQLDNIDVGIRPYLAEIGHEKWSRAFFTGGRYSIMTANIAESMNIVDGSAREMPVATLVEWLITWMDRWFTEKRHEAESTVTVLAAATEKVLRENQVAALPLVVLPIDSNLSRVYDGDNLFVVNLDEKICSCRRFNLDQIPCRHALAVLAKKRLNPYAYCSRYYKKEELLATYQEEINLLGNPRTWSIPDDVKLTEVLPPISTEKSSRLKRKRLSFSGEHNSQSKCGRCGQPGHNRKTCKALAIQPSSSLVRRSTRLSGRITSDEVADENPSDEVADEIQSDEAANEVPSDDAAYENEVVKQLTFDEAANESEVVKQLTFDEAANESEVVQEKPSDEVANGSEAAKENEFAQEIPSDKVANGNEVAQEIPSDEVANGNEVANEFPSNEIKIEMPSVPSDEVAKEIPSDEVAKEIPSDEVANEIPSDQVAQEVPSA